MSYKIEIRKNHRAYPVIVCDHCEVVIGQAATGNAVWLEDLSSSAGKQFEVFHVHNRCGRAFEKGCPEKEGARWMSNGIDHQLFMLLHNCRYNPEETKRKAEILATLD